MPTEIPAAKTVTEPSALGRWSRRGWHWVAARLLVVLSTGVVWSAPPKAERKTPPPPPMPAGPPCHRVAVEGADIEYRLLPPADVAVGHRRPVLVWLSARGESAPTVTELTASLGPVAAKAGVGLLLAGELAAADAKAETWHTRLRAVLADAGLRGPLAPDRTILLLWGSATTAAVPRLPNLEGDGRVVGLALLSAVRVPTPPDWTAGGPPVLVVIGTGDARWPGARAIQEQLATAKTEEPPRPFRLVELAGVGPGWSPALADGLTSWVEDIARGRVPSGTAPPRVPTRVWAWAVGFAERAAKSLSAPPDAPPSGWTRVMLPKPVGFRELHRPADWHEPTDTLPTGVFWLGRAPSTAAAEAMRMLIRLDEGRSELTPHLANRTQQLAVAGVRYELLAVQELTLFGQGPATLTLEHVRAIRLRTAGVPEDGLAEHPTWILTLWRPGPAHTTARGQWLQFRVEWPSTPATSDGIGDPVGDSAHADLAVRLLRQLRPTLPEDRR